jgi:hypothetical protein
VPSVIQQLKILALACALLVPAALVEAFVELDILYLRRHPRTPPLYRSHVRYREEIAIWIAYKMKRDARAAWKMALDDRETIEDDLVNDPTIMALSSDPLLALNSEASSQKYLEDYFVSKLAFTADYLRTIT